MPDWPFVDYGAGKSQAQRGVLRLLPWLDRVFHHLTPVFPERT